MLLKIKLIKQDNAGHLFYFIFIFFNKQNKNKNTHTHTHIHTQKKDKKRKRDEITRSRAPHQSGLKFERRFSK